VPFENGLVKIADTMYWFYPKTCNILYYYYYYCYYCDSFRSISGRISKRNRHNRNEDKREETITGGAIIFVKPLIIYAFIDLFFTWPIRWSVIISYWNVFSACKRWIKFSVDSGTYRYAIGILLKVVKRFTINNDMKTSLEKFP